MTSEEFRAEREAEKAQAENLIIPYKYRIEKHRSSYVDIWLRRISEDKGIPAEVKWAWWDLKMRTAREVFLMPSPEIKFRKS